MIKIQSVDGKTLFEGEFKNLRDTLENANLFGANLSWANLSRANLSGANLSEANLFGANLSRANLSGANLSWANLSRANLSGANLSGANLSGANLSGANLSWANLSWANLSWANLSRANLFGANLSGAEGLNPNRTDSLRMLRDQPGKIRAYKLVTADWKSPISPQNGWGELEYKVGTAVTVPEADTDEMKSCAVGVNLADLPWVMREWKPGYRILICEFTAKDIAAIPVGTDGKFRVRRCKVVGERDLVEIGLVEKDETSAAKGKSK